MAGVLVAVAGLGAQPAAAADPVVNAINREVKSRRLDRATGRQYKSWWRASGRAMRTLRRRGDSSRANEISNIRILTISLARRRKLSRGRLDPAIANVRATTYVFRYGRYPRARDRITVPFDSVTYAYYPGNGIQFQPLFTFTWANKLYSNNQDMLLVETMERAMELSVTRNGYPTWEYYFNFGGGAPPWVSAMAQATGIQALGRTWERTGNPRYKRIAERAMRGFSVKGRDGGLMTGQSGGRWYLLYGFLPGQRVLNGHLQALLGLDEYADKTGSQRARILVNKGVRGSSGILRKFDTGAWSNYVPGVEATVGYHDLMTTQLSRLGNRLNNDDFRQLGRRFAAYRITAPRIVLPRQRLRPLYPAPRDGWRDQWAIRYFLDKRATVTFSVKNPAGRVIWQQDVSGGRGRKALIWNGRNGAGRAVLPGTYTLHMNARDILGNTREAQLTAALVVRRDVTNPEILQTVVRGAGRGRYKVLVKIREQESPYVDLVAKRGSRTVVRLRTRRSRAVLRLPRGVRAKGLIIRVTDSSGRRSAVRLS